jgi:hypothetical protein
MGRPWKLTSSGFDAGADEGVESWCAGVGRLAVVVILKEYQSGSCVLRTCK